MTLLPVVWHIWFRVLYCLPFAFPFFSFTHRRDAIASIKLNTTRVYFRFDRVYEIGASRRCRNARQQLLEPVPTSRCLESRTTHVQQFLVCSKNQSLLVSKNLAASSYIVNATSRHISVIGNVETISIYTRRKRILLSRRYCKFESD